MPSAMLTQIVAHDRVHLLSDFACEVADFLAPEVYAECTRYLSGEVVYLVKNAIAKLLPAGGYADYQHALAFTRIAQSRVGFAGGQVVVG